MCPICKAEYPETIYKANNVVIGCDDCTTFYATTEEIKPILCAECGNVAAKSATEEHESGDFFQAENGTIYCAGCICKEDGGDYERRLAREAFYII